MAHKFRHVLSGEFPHGSIPRQVVKYKHRPIIEVDSKVKDVNDASVYEILESKWLPWEVVFIDQEDNEQTSQLLTLLGDFYQDWPNQSVDDKLGTLTLEIYNGAGTMMESWMLTKVSPASITFTDDYGGTSDIVVTWKYEKAIYNPHLSAASN